METNREQWLTNQYPENWSAKVAADSLCKIIEGKGKFMDSERSSSTQSPKDVKPTMLILQYISNQSQVFCREVTKFNKRSSGFYHKKKRIVFTLSEVSFLY